MKNNRTLCIGLPFFLTLCNAQDDAALTGAATTTPAETAVAMGYAAQGNVAMNEALRKAELQAALQKAREKRATQQAMVNYVQKPEPITTAEQFLAAHRPPMPRSSGPSEAAVASRQRSYVPEFEAQTGRRLHLQRPQHAAQTPLAGQMPHHPGLSIKQGLELEQRVAAAGQIEGVVPVQHQAFATARHHLVKARLQGLAIGHAKLLHQLQPGNARPGNDATQAFDPVGEGASPVGLLEHHVLDLPPIGITGHLAAYDARQGIKAPTGDPQLPVQGLWRQAGDEPGRRMNRPPTAKTQAATVPHRPGTIELLADPVAGDIHLAAQHLGQEQRRRISTREH